MGGTLDEWGGGNKLQKVGGWVIRYFLTRHESVQELGICTKPFLILNYVNIHIMLIVIYM